MTRTTRDVGLCGLGAMGPGGLRLWLWPARRRLVKLAGECLAVAGAVLVTLALAVLMFCM